MEFDDFEWQSVKGGAMGNHVGTTAYIRREVTVPSLEDYSVLNVRVKYMGGVDDFGRNVRHLRGNFQIGMALSRYNRNRSRWVFGADYVKKHYAYKKIAVPKEQFTAEAGCLFPFLSDRGRNVFLSAGLSALAGYERVNRNGRLLYDGATLLHKGAFIYGFAPAFEMEAYLTDRWAFLFNVRQRVFFGSSVGHFHTVVAVGLKYIID